MKKARNICKRFLVAFLSVSLLCSGFLTGWDGIWEQAKAEDLFVFDGTNAAEYAGQETIEFDTQTLDQTDTQVETLMQACSASALKVAVFKKSVTVIGREVFKNCYALTKVDFSQATNLKVIEDYAFSGCVNLEESVYRPYAVAATVSGTLYLPSGLSYFGEAAFSDSKFSAYNISYANNSFATGTDGILYNKNLNTLIAFPPAKESVTISDSVSEIYRYAFEGSIIRSISIPSTVKTIGKKAFYNSLLKSVRIDSEAQITIGSGAFYQDWQDPEHRDQYVNAQAQSYGGISQVYIPQATYENSSTYFEATDETACFTPYVKAEESSYGYALGCDVYVVPDVTVSGIPQTWVKSANLNCYWDNNSYYNITALYLDGNREITFDPGTTASNAIEVTEKGEYTLTIRYTNKNGNLATSFMKIAVDYIDATAPAEVTYTMVDDVCYLHSYDTESGIDQIKYTVNNSDTDNYSNGFTLQPGVNIVRAWATDKVGNVSATKEYKITIAGEQRSISLDTTSKQLKKGKAFQLHVSFQPSNVTNKDITWMSSDSSIASVAADGTVTGVRVGYAVITAISNAGYEAKCAVVVTKDPTVKKQVSIYKAGTYKITVGNLRSDYDVTYTSDDTKVCKVNSSGKITGVNIGEATVITRVDTGVRVYSLKTVVTVSKPVVKITTKPSRVKVGASYRFKAYKKGISSSIRWSSSNSNIATINRTTGKVIGQSKGTVVITAKAGKYRSTYRLKIK